tara:strand:+ start:26478 stop:27713 length:1236 start_codon:yes stop_codon:yes gene_type:complete
MSIKITKAVLENYLKRVLFEDVYNTYTDVDNSRAGTQFEPADIPSPPETPVLPSEQMAVQLSANLPPVDDDTYIPANPVELGLAADALGQRVPNDQVEYFYNRLQDLLDSAVEKHENPEIADDVTDAEVVELETNESHKIEKLRKSLKILLEQMDIDFDENEYEEFRKGYQTFDPEEEEEESLTLDQVEQIEGMGLEDLATKFGYSAASGVRQSLERILGRLNFTMENVDESELDAIKQTAISEFVEMLEGEGYIDKNDMADLLAAPGEVEALDSFRFFLVGGFLLPAYQNILRTTRKRVESEIEKLGLPKRSKQTLLHQVFGDTPKNPEKLKNKIMKDAASEKMDVNQTEKAVKNALQAFSKLSNLAKVEGDLISTAYDAWNKAGASKRKKVLAQALQATATHQDEFGKE